MNHNFLTAMAVHRKMKMAKGGIVKETLKDKVRAMMMKKMGKDMPKDDPEMMSEGGMPHCSHGGPVKCAMGCYAEGGEVDADESNLKEDYDHAMESEMAMDSKGKDNAEPDLHLSDEDDEKMKRKGILAKILASR